MSEIVKIWLSEMLEKEIKEVNGTISNNCLWMHSAETQDESEMFCENVASLEEYKTLLLEMKRQVELEGKINV